MSKEEGQNDLRALPVGCGGWMLRKDSGTALPRTWSLTDLGVQVGGREQPVALISAWRTIFK